MKQNHLFRLTALFSLILASLAFSACGDDAVDGTAKPSPCTDDPAVAAEGERELCPVVDLTKPVAFDADASPPERLAAYNLFEWEPGTMNFRFNERVVPYEMNTELFTDYAVKMRAIYVPEGASGSFDPKRVFDFPVGSLILKNFMLPEDMREPEKDVRLIETRVYVHTSKGWRGYPYIWDASGEYAFYAPGGEVRDISFIDADGETLTSRYLVPQQNQCIQCHELKDPVTGTNFQTLIGPKARYLNRDRDYGDGPVNQLTKLEAEGLLTGLPSLDSVERAYDFRDLEGVDLEELDDDTITKAARDYLDINCAHCHNPQGIQGISSNLFLNYDLEEMLEGRNWEHNLGICKRPGSAGNMENRSFDIVPGDPDDSILIFRVESTKPGQMMPVLARSLRHHEATDLLREWVLRMEPRVCGVGTED